MGLQPVAANQELDPALYEELRALAHRQLRGEGPNQTVCTTVLANDAYLKLAGQSDAQVQDRVHFLALAAIAMRRILVSYARGRVAHKRGGGEVMLTFDDAVAGAAASADDLLAFDEVLTRLEAASTRQAQVAVFRVFGGLSEAEIAAELGVAIPTVGRDWRFARAWLSRELGRDLGPDV